MSTLTSRRSTLMERRIAQPLSTSRSRIRVKAGDNWLLAGRKGSGKTVFSKTLLNHLISLYPTARVYILDVKMRDFQDYPGLVQTAYEPPPPPTQQFQVWQPMIEDPESIEAWLFRIRKDPPAIVDIDELLALCYGPRDTSKEFRNIQKLGRDLPIGTIAGTQELVQIPRNAVAQADHFIRFRLKHPYDRRYMDTLIGETDDPADKYGFYYAHADDQGEPHYFSDYQNFF